MSSKFSWNNSILADVQYMPTKADYTLWNYSAVPGGCTLHRYHPYSLLTY